MKLGMSSYCLTPAMKEGRKTIYDVIDFAVENGCEHIEFVPFYLPFVDEEKKVLNYSLIDSVRDKCRSVNLEISTYSVNADIINEDPKVRESEMERVKLHIQAACRLGISRMRHDIASYRRPFSMNTVRHFEKEFPLMVENTRILADYAACFGIKTTLENHGFFCNGSDRILRILEAVDRPVGLTMDVGNFLCVDEYSEAAVKKCLPYADIIHLKDFYIRDKSKLPGQTEMFNCSGGSWFETLGGKMLRGSILGQGDLDIWAIVRLIKNSKFNGYVSLEFEGMEESERGTQISLAMAKAIFNEA